MSPYQHDIPVVVLCNAQVVFPQAFLFHRNRTAVAGGSHKKAASLARSVLAYPPFFLDLECTPAACATGIET